MKLKLVLGALLALLIFACQSERGSRGKKSSARKVDPSLIMVTGYCNCGRCCGWERSWFGFGPAVYNYGKMKGARKDVGITATGKKAKFGTIAADPRVFKFGTKFNIPGYGEGVVEDIGGAIKGKHIDIWFSNHADAKRWGVKYFRPEQLKIRR